MSAVTIMTIMIKDDDCGDYDDDDDDSDDEFFV